MRLKSELYYYSGSCGDSSTLEQIKNNFKVVVNDRGVWNNSCSDCTVENVVVYCGNVTSDRKSRSVSVYPKVYRIYIFSSFSFNTNYHSFNCSSKN